jgi:TPP-dependent pyruvate/acetoin dehydrogenase alpha subunit
LHFNYYRFLEHVGPLEDFDKGYRTKPVDMIEKWDPVPKIHAAALKGGVSAERLKKIEHDFLKQIEISVAKAKAAPFPPPAELFADVFAPDKGV